LTFEEDFPFIIFHFSFAIACDFKPASHSEMDHEISTATQERVGRLVGIQSLRESARVMS
jgi:hypothetical protein